jgi:hypothetical protein
LVRELELGRSTLNLVGLVEKLKGRGVGLKVLAKGPQSTGRGQRES